MKANATVQAQLNCGAQRANAGPERLKGNLKKNYVYIYMCVCVCVLLTAKQETLLASYLSVTINHWNRLMTSALEFWKIK
jgi:hypothetical protein